MRRARILLLPLVGLFLAAQWVQPKIDPPRTSKQPAAWDNPSLDPRIANVLKRSCGDCHSNQTRWPWYARLSPVSWWLNSHVKQAQLHLNLSELTQFSDSDRDEISDEVKFGTMPLKSYLLMHPAARVSEEERKLLNDWANGTLQNAR